MQNLRQLARSQPRQTCHAVTALLKGGTATQQLSICLFAASTARLSPDAPPSEVGVHCTFQPGCGRRILNTKSVARSRQLPM